MKVMLRNKDVHVKVTLEERILIERCMNIMNFLEMLVFLTNNLKLFLSSKQEMFKSMTT